MGSDGVDAIVFVAEEAGDREGLVDTFVW